ncbi:glycoside hydrolase family 3 C-terminal domain-containing protein [Glutamicibacter arilaitensis]|nr:MULTISPECIES: glycoside hydrolase family 3 C-terminal domain-containing protein [Glutamicibacter]
MNNKNTSSYKSDDPESGMNPEHISPIAMDGIEGLDGASPFGAADACVTQGAESCTDNGLRFGGSLPWESSILDFTGMAESQSWEISPSLDTIKQVMSEVEDPSKVVMHVYFRQPFVMDETSGLREAGAIVAGFGMTDTALMDVLSGKFSPQGRMPFALAGTREAITEQFSDLPGYAETSDGALFDYSFGLSY